MFNLLKKEISREEIAKLIQHSSKALEEFERQYKEKVLNSDEISDNLFEIPAKEAVKINQEKRYISNGMLEGIIDDVVDELVSQTQLFTYDGKGMSYLKPTVALDLVSAGVVNHMPREIRPQLTGNLLSVDCDTHSYVSLLQCYLQYLKEKNPKKKQYHYDRFRQGLDLLDLDPIVYQIIDTNPISIGYWLPKIIPAVEQGEFFKIPKTKIIKVPLSLLQLTRKDYMELTPTTLKIVDRYCQKIFGLDTTKDYFIKTGTYSSKYDFRNAHIHAGKEVMDIGEYLLYIHFQALCMAHYDLSGRNQPCIYGVSTTTEWCVREFIQDEDNAMTIYNGLPLHNEYRAFVDFDTKKVMDIFQYWDEKVMLGRFSKCSDSDTDKNKHDYITFMAYKDKLRQKYLESRDVVWKNLEAILGNIPLSGQWSIDIMQNGDKFYIIDMAQAENSTFYDRLSLEIRKPSKEKWIPDVIKLED